MLLLGLVFCFALDGFFHFLEMFPDSFERQMLPINQQRRDY